MSHARTHTRTHPCKKKEKKKRAHAHPPSFSGLLWVEAGAYSVEVGQGADQTSISDLTPQRPHTPKNKNPDTHVKLIGLLTVKYLKPAMNYIKGYIDCVFVAALIKH